MKDWKQRVDGWVNSVIGLGQVATDKRLSGYHAEGVTPTATEYETLFYEDGLASRIVTELPFAALRQGFELTTTSDMDAQEKAQAEELLWQRLEDLQATSRMFEASIWGRLFGGAVILIGTEEADWTEPLDLDKPHQIQFLRVYDNVECQPRTRYTDWRTPEYGQVESYAITPSDGIGTSFVVHASRCLRFGGILTSRRQRARLNYWDHSVLRRARDELRDFNTLWASVATMVTDGSMGTLKIRGLWEVMSGKLREQFQERLEVINLARWSGRIMPIDTEEDFAYTERTYAGLPDLLDRWMLRLSSITGMPATKLFGMSPAGMNATGESDTRNWYDQVGDQRDMVFGPPLRLIVHALALGLGLTEPESWGISWPSLWQETALEETTRRGAITTSDVAYIQAGVLNPDEVAMARFGTGVWSDAAPQLDMDARTLRDETEAKANAEVAALEARMQALETPEPEPEPEEVKETPEPEPEDEEVVL
jgi:phage-related protein (TIGR01555 family)